jgi:hemoglobin
MADLAGREDLERLLRDFYSRAFEDDLLRHVFVDVVSMDLEEHLPKIVDFWQKVLFNSGTYDGRVMEVHRRVHRRVPLTTRHFSRWLELWRESLDAGFTGPVAEQADAHARRMALALLRNLSAAEQARSLPVVPAARRRG